MNRRSFVAGAAACAVAGSRALFARNAKLQIGVTDWNLRQTAKVEAVGFAKRLGFDGIQVSLGRTPADGRLLLDNAELQAKYVAEAKAQGVSINGTCLDILHVNYLKNDPLGKKWVADSIPITRKLESRIVLLPFFGNGALTTKQEMDYVADVLRDLGPEAEKQKVILGLENTVSAEDNLRILDRARSKAVLVYYDIGNSARNGFDVPREIRLLGNKRICQFHFKDNPGYIGEGKIDFGAVVHAISEIEYRGWANLETDSPSKSVEGDMKRNLTYVRKVLADNRI